MVRDGNMSIDFGIAWNVEMGSCSFDVGEPEKRVWITVSQCVLKTGQGDGVIF